MHTHDKSVNNCRWVQAYRLLNEESQLEQNDVHIARERVAETHPIFRTNAKHKLRRNTCPPQTSKSYTNRVTSQRSSCCQVWLLPWQSSKTAECDEPAPMQDAVQLSVSEALLILATAPMTSRQRLSRFSKAHGKRMVTAVASADEQTSV
jgi:hypothetical protein